MKFYSKEKFKKQYYREPNDSSEYKRGDAPKLFYTPEEFNSPSAIVELYFDNFSLAMPPISSENLSESNLSLFRVRYQKLHFKNFKYPYLFVMYDKQKDFLDWYFPNNPDVRGYDR